MQLRLPNYEARFQKEFEANRAFVVTSDEAISRKLEVRTGGIFDKNLGDVYRTDQDLREYSCTCGVTRGRFYENKNCPECGDPVSETYGADFKRFGWIDIEPYRILTPVAYQLVGKIVGKRTGKLNRILEYNPDYNIDGMVKDRDLNSVDGIGILEFQKRFFEILTPLAAKSGKEDILQFLKENFHCIFTSKIPLLNTFLRPIYISDSQNILSFDSINKSYMKIVRAAKMIKRYKKPSKIVIKSLQIIQTTWGDDLYQTIITTKLSGKEKLIRSQIVGTRMSYSSRMVITSLVDENTAFDSCSVSYKGFLELYTLEILNCMRRGIGSEKFVFNTEFQNLKYLNKVKYSSSFDPDVYAIMDFLVKNHRDGLYVLINRNPTLEFGSIQCFRIMNVDPDPKKLVLKIPLNSLNAMNADFDGDTLNVYALKEKRVAEEFRRKFSTRALTVDRTGDDLYNSDFGLLKDELTNLWSLMEPLQTF